MAGGEDALAGHDFKEVLQLQQLEQLGDERRRPQQPHPAAPIAYRLVHRDQRADAVAVQHTLSRNQRLAVMVSAFSAAAAAILGFLNFYVGK